jgi:hypothetical protein
MWRDTETRRSCWAEGSRPGGQHGVSRIMIIMISAGVPVGFKIRHCASGEIAGPARRRSSRGRELIPYSIIDGEKLWKGGD